MLVIINVILGIGFFIGVLLIIQGYMQSSWVKVSGSAENYACIPRTECTTKRSRSKSSSRSKSQNRGTRSTTVCKQKYDCTYKNVKYTVGDKTYTLSYTSRTLSHPSSSVTFYYHPDNPEDTRQNPPLTWTSLSGIILCLACLLVRAAITTTNAPVPLQNQTTDANAVDVTGAKE